MKNIIALISGRGSNLKSLIDNSKYYKITHVISSSKNALGIQYAKEKSIPVTIIDKIDYSSLSASKDALIKCLTNLNPDLICLAGFMQIIREDLINKFYPKIINIHPSLLPDFPGLNTHQRVLESKQKIHGCSVHLVDNGVDTGTIIAQAKVDVSGLATADLLAEKVLEQEHLLYPWVINNISNNKITIKNNCIVFDQKIENPNNFILNKSVK